jgi:Flp pilus assembly protein CpaB
MNLENKKQIAVIALAIGFGLVASLLANEYTQRKINEETAKLAKKFSKDEQALKNEIDILRNEVKTLAARQMTLAQQGAPAGVKEGVSESIPRSSLSLRTPPGKRALTIRIDSLSAVGGLINPGDYVDVLAHLKVPSDEDGAKTDIVTAVIFQNVQVLAVGTNLQVTGGYADQQNARALNITVAVNPEEIGLFTFAQRRGNFQLVLRAPEETGTEMLQVASWEALSDYVLDKFGMELVLPKSQANIIPVGSGISSSGKSEEAKPYIQIFRAGKQNN